MALGISLNDARPVKYITTTPGAYVVLDSSLVAADLPTAYMFWAVDSSDDVWVRRLDADGSWETGPGVKISAGKSMIIPVNTDRTAAGYFRKFIYAGGLADTLMYLGWDR
jgi:hypothetical protein